MTGPKKHAMPSLRVRAVAATAFLFFASLLQAAGHSALAVRATQPPIIDGIIYKEEWAGVTRLENFIQLEPEQGKPATQRTVAYFAYDDSYVYIAVHSYDTEPEKITARLNRRDDNLSRDDSVTVFLDTFHDRRTCYFFSTNPLGTQTDGRIKDDGRVRDRSWDAEWLVAAQTDSDGWTAEFAIPLRAMQFHSGENRSWGINIGRSRRSNLEHSFWAGPLESSYRVSQFGEILGLTLHGSAKRWDLIPYVQGGYAQGRNTSGSMGLDLRYAFRPETMANLTINPDFAIIEADEEFVNLSRFEVRLEEKRPFFLESNERFRQRIQTFYSRRIQDIDIGGKLLSRNGPWDLALLSVRSSPMEVDSEPDGASTSEHANYTVARAERQVLRSSNIGFMVANRSLGGDNRGSIGLDTTMHLTRTMRFTGQLLRSHGLFKMGRWAYFMRPAWDTSTSHFHFRYTHLGDRFGDNVNAVGFIRDDDRREMDSNLDKNFWFGEGPVQRIFLQSKNKVYWSQQNILRYYHNIETMEVEFRNRWSVEASHRNVFELFEKGFHNDQVEFNVGYNTREFQSWQVGYQTGRNFDSNLDAISARIRRKLTAGLALEYQLSRVWLDPDPEKKATFINVVRVRQNFTRDLFIRVFFQTNSVIDRKNLEAVFVWRHRPPFGSIQFAFQRGRAAFGQRSEQGNTYFVKIGHVF